MLLLNSIISKKIDYSPQTSGIYGIYINRITTPYLPQIIIEIISYLCRKLRKHRYFLT